MFRKKYRYPALLLKQVKDSPPLVLFSASAVHISEWAGIPQKTRILNGESLGFQRDDDPSRVDQLAKFFSDPRNVIHNPLLCAIREKAGISVTFDYNPAGDNGDGTTIDGFLEIQAIDRSAQPLRHLFRDAREALEARVPELAGRQDPEERVTELLPLVDSSLRSFLVEQSSDVEEDDREATYISPGAFEGDAEDALFEESHVAEFWTDLRSREILLNRLGDEFKGDAFLGFERDSLISYLQPLILVDGQHRLLGAMEAARQAIDSNNQVLTEMSRLISAGIDPEMVSHQLLMQSARYLPISLLMDENPAEHVFQFVVVNQKATPVRPALLATIISTSLSDEELTPISDRLEEAGIPLKSSRAITYFARNERSPFVGLVTRGFSEEGNDLLPWTVLGQLVAMFRDLRGAKYFHDSKLDYADAWKRRILEQSNLADPTGTPYETHYDVWSQHDGPWREVFIAFWAAVKRELASTNPEAFNFWGTPRSSNLFNKPSLLTLATDFFAFINEVRKPINEIVDVDVLVEDWLFGIDRSYFARNWKLKELHVKKDSTGIRKQWSKIWYTYRRDPRRLPDVKLYTTLYRES